MVALKRSGNQEAARRSAETYLRVYPSGPYAAVARDMLGE
jgi:TolA-binding protein